MKPDKPTLPALDDQPTAIGNLPVSPHPPEITGSTNPVAQDATAEGSKAKSSGQVIAAMESQKTVISRQSPIGDRWNGASPLELGMTLEGKRLGHFELESFVGGGGMGAVFRAHDTMLSRTVAVKVLSRDQSTDSETLRRFKNEAQSAARLDHENIARVYFVGEDEGWHFIVFEFIDGENIRDLVERRGPLPLDDAIHYLLQVAEALAHASKRDVVHRDIKPSNLLVTADGRAKLVDMGLARLHQVEAGESDLTASGVTLGTFDYISPEQARDPRMADVRSDLYSLGCTLYFMLTGRPPFPNGTVLQKLLSHSSEKPPDPRRLRPDLPEEVTAIIFRLLAKKPEDRYQDPRELIGELLILADKLGLDSSSHGRVWISRDQASGWMEKVVPWAVPLIVLVLTVVGLDRYWAYRDGVSQPPPAFRAPRSAAALFSPRLAENATESLLPGDASQPVVPGDLSEKVPTAGINSSAGSASNSGGSTSPIATNNMVPPATLNIAVPGASGSGAALPSGNDSPTSGTGSGGSVSPANGDSSTSPEGGMSVPKSAPRVVPGTPVGAGREGSPSPMPTNPPARDMEMPSGEMSPMTTPMRGTMTETAVVPRRLIVSPSIAASRLLPEEIFASSLYAALADEKIVELLPKLDAIEIRSTTPMLELPWKFSLPRNSTVTIRGVGEKPVVIRFAPESLDALGSTMIDIAGGKLVLENVHVEFVIPRGDSLRRWSLIAMHAGKDAQVLLDRCSFSVIGGDAGGFVETNQRVAFIDFVTPVRQRVSADTVRPVADMPVVMPVNIANCIFRGDATLLRMQRSLPIDVVWRNGLIVTRQRVLEADGSDDPAAETRHGSIRMTLSNVTVAADQGLCLLSDRTDAPYQPPLELECNQCVISSIGGSLIEHDGVGANELYQQRLFIKGSRNYYEDIDIFWRVRIRGIETDAWDWNVWKKRLAADGSMPSFSVPLKWQRQRSQVSPLPLFERGPSEYLLAPEDSNPAFRAKAGFLPDELPALPALAKPQTLPAAAPPAS